MSILNTLVLMWLGRMHNTNGMAYGMEEKMRSRPSNYLSAESNKD